MTDRPLGEFERVVLFAVLHLGDGAYGASVLREIEERTGRRASTGAVYTALDRLEARRLVASHIGDPTPERGGRRRKHVALTATGARVLQASYEEFLAMADGAANRLRHLARERS